MHSGSLTLAQIQAAADVVRARLNTLPSVGVILGSGLSPLAEMVQAPTFVPYDQIPHYATSTVPGHAGRLVIGQLAGHTVIVMQGRVHFYEGHSAQCVTLPIRVMQLLGVKTLLVTNAAGGLNPSFRAGDLMVISDQINLVGMTGHNPLVGANEEALGPRFPDMSHVYDPELMALAHRVAADHGFRLQQGVYVCLSGPAFETPAEVRFLRLIGGDAVGMSTAPEVTVARHAGMRVLGVSGITNVAITDPSFDKETTHQEVLETGQLIAPRLMSLLQGVLAGLPHP